MKKIRLSKDKKRVFISFVIILIILVILLSVFLIKEYSNRKLIKSIKNHYNTTIITSKNTKLYTKNKKEIGSVDKGVSFKLNKIKINDISDQYFNIDGTDYYLYYKDVEKTKSTSDIDINDKYLVFNKNIETKNVTFYDKSKKITINFDISLPIRYMDDDYYYVLYLNKLLKIKKSSDDNIVDTSNTEEKEAEYISVINYQTISNSEECSSDSCVNITKFREQLNVLKEKGYYTITLEQYSDWLDGNIRLKEKAILLTTNTNNESFVSINNDSKLKIELVDDSVSLKFSSSNKKSTKDSKKDSIESYTVKTSTSIESFSKMIEGEDVVEVSEVPKSSTTKEQSIAVINYHFFYDGSAGESCNESICLDVKNFREQLSYLKDNGYKTLKMSEFKKWMYGEIELPEKSVLLTIDDGAMGTGKHNGNKLIPILEEYDMNATLFLISGWWDVNNYRSSNLDIQSHTYDMHQYGSCGRGQVVCSSHDELLNDLQKSLQIVDNDDSFCFPFYSYTEEAISVVKEAGFKMSFIGGNRKAKRSDDKYKIPRYPVYKNTSLNQFIYMVS